jgi:hypothetical protein
MLARVLRQPGCHVASVKLQKQRIGREGASRDPNRAARRVALCRIAASRPVASLHRARLFTRAGAAALVGALRACSESRTRDPLILHAQQAAADPGEIMSSHLAAGANHSIRSVNLNIA